MYILSMKDTRASEHRPKILIVDDEDNLRRILATMLEGFGYDVTAACDGADGVAKLDADAEIRFVLCDVRMRTSQSTCLLYTSPSPRDLSTSRMPSSA